MLEQKRKTKQTKQNKNQKKTKKNESKRREEQKNEPTLKPPSDWFQEACSVAQHAQRTAVHDGAVAVVEATPHVRSDIKLSGIRIRNLF